MKIDADSLLTFLAVAEKGSINRAAIALNKSQPSLTRTIKQLEASIGALLFERGAKGVRLTPAGEIVIGHARTVRFELLNTERAALNLRAGQHVQVNIGTAPIHPVDLLGKVLIEVSTLFPSVKFNVVVGSEAELLERLQQGELNLILVPLPRSADLSSAICNVVYLDELAIYGCKDHRLASFRNLSAQELHSATWVLGPPGTLLRDRVESLFIGEGLPPPNVVLDVEDVALRRALVMQSQHISVFPNHQVHQLVKAGHLVPLKYSLSQDRRPIVAVRLGRDHTKITDLLLARLRQYCKQINLRVPQTSIA